MSGLSIRARLTLVIVVITAIISAVGVLFGMSVLEGQIREAAIDDRAEEFTEFGEAILFTDPFAEVFEVDGDLVEASGGFTVMSAAEEADLVMFVTEYVQLLPDFDEAVSRVGTADGELLVWPGDNTLVAVSTDRARVVQFDEADDNPIVPFTALLELGFLPTQFEILDDPFFEQPDSADFTLEFGQRQFDGVQVGLIAEVSDELDALDAIRDVLRNVVIALTVLAGIATWFIAGRALRPVGAITDQVGEITSGTLSERVPEPKGDDEIGVLARTMNSMLGRLETSDLRRRQFVSDASHELRTPVAVLRSEAEVARRAPESTTIDDFAEVVLSESDRLERLVEDLLALARGDESRMPATSSTIDVDEIVLAEAGRARALPVDRRAVSAGRVIGHQDVMTRVIAHLLDNAARHGVEAVAVGVQTLGETVRVWVDDDGPGISEQQRRRIFERFIRLDDARSRDSGGAGLGLAVVHAAVAQMNGTIEVFDSPLGGARFQIDLPAA